MFLPKRLRLGRGVDLPASMYSPTRQRSLDALRRWFNIVASLCSASTGAQNPILARRLILSEECRRPALDSSARKHFRYLDYLRWCVVEMGRYSDCPRAHGCMYPGAVQPSCQCSQTFNLWAPEKHKRRAPYREIWRTDQVEVCPCDSFYKQLNKHLVICLYSLQTQFQKKFYRHSEWDKIEEIRGPKYVEFRGRGKRPYCKITKIAC